MIEMKRIAFFLDNSHIASVDCRGILEGNPGIGGTEYMFIVVAYLLSVRDNDLDVMSYVTSEGKFPEGYGYEVVTDFLDAVAHASAEGFDCLVFKHDAGLIASGVLDAVDTDLKLIVWDHVFVCYWELDYYANNPRIYKIVNVGREMNDLYRDHKAFGKSTYIYNCLNLDGLREKVGCNPFEERKNIVVYVGALKPYKGFHLLAQAWPAILKEVPDAELYVIGTGRLYGKGEELGSYGLAERPYEEWFMRYLSKNGKILPSVHFMGDMGCEKNDILLRAKVGVPNPSGITETFCISAVEMQAAGALVTTIDYPGFIDTVRNGVLYHKVDDLAKTVVELLRSKNTRYMDVMDSFDRDFSYDAVARQWEALLCRGLYVNGRMRNGHYRLKWLKEIKRRLSVLLPFMYKVPSVERILLFLERMRKGRVTYIDSDIDFVS